MKKTNNEQTTIFNNRFNKRRQSAWFGMLVIAFGLILLGFNMGFIPHEIRRILISWQMLLIVIGLFNLCFKRIISGFVLLLTGGFFLLPRLAMVLPEYFGWVPSQFTHLFWPLLLIMAGILIMVCHSRKRTYHSHFQRYTNHEESNCGGHFRRSVMFSGSDILVVDPVFYGCELNSIFGGIELDLRKTALPEGITTIEANVIFGGITIFVPEDWYVETSQMDSIFGGFSDDRTARTASDTTRKLVIKGACVFGGGELKN